jgi:hypothetical protein
MPFESELYVLNCCYKQIQFAFDICGTCSRAIAEVVSRWLPTAAARVCAWVWQEEFVVDKVALGQVFSI